MTFGTAGLGFCCCVTPDRGDCNEADIIRPPADTGRAVPARCGSPTGVRAEVEALAPLRLGRGVSSLEKFSYPRRAFCLILCIWYRRWRAYFARDRFVVSSVVGWELETLRRVVKRGREIS